MNTQPIEKSRPDDGLLEVHSIFFTIQGEGPYTGRPAVFVRLAGCNLQCPLCDTEYTSGRFTASPEQLLYYVNEQGNHLPPRPLVVITGGEPFRQQLVRHVLALVDAGYMVQVETNGTLPVHPALADLPEELFTLVVSPKAGKVHQTVASRADAWKYVMRAGEEDLDGLPLKALDHSNGGGLARHPHGFPVHRIYLQPCDNKEEVANRRNLEACVTQVQIHGYTLQTQLHKQIGVE